MQQNSGSSAKTSFLPKRRSDLNVRMIDGEAVVLDRNGGRVHQLNQTASFIWNQCNGQVTIEDIAGQLAHAYDVDVEVATKDIRDAIEKFRELNLLD